MKRSVVSLALLLCLIVPVSGLTVMSYNVQNLFDDIHNGTEFQEFDPSRGAWNTEFFHVRLDTIAEVVRKAVPGGPDILLLQEIENENALNALVDGALKGMGYQWKVLVPKKGLAANVAILSRLPVARVRSHAVGPWKGSNPVRDVVEAEIEASGHTLYVFNNHWKSKTEGVKATEPSRLASAAVLAQRIHEILAQDPAADILAAGDLNENLDEYQRTGGKYQTALMPDTATQPAKAALQSIFLSASARGLGLAGERLVLYEPWFEIAESRRGSYAYQGEWLTVDHMLLSPGLLDSRGFSYLRGSFGPARLPFLLSSDGLPKRWKGLEGDRGFSDHLPILITLDVKK